MTIGSEGADPHLGDEVSIFLLLFDEASVGDHLLSHGTDDIVRIDQIMGSQDGVGDTGNGFGPGEEVRVEKNAFPFQGAEVDLRHGGIDRVRHEQLIGCRVRFGGPTSCYAAQSK